SLPAPANTAFPLKLQDPGTTPPAGADDTSDIDNTLTISVTHLNHAPDSTQLNNVITITQDTPGSALQVGDFNFTDVDNDGFTAVRISQLPTAGQLLLDGNAVAQFALINVSQIAGNHLTFVPAANAQGPTYATFTFQVKDNGLTASGGVDLDPVPNAITFSVTSVNDAPQGTDRLIQ